MVNVSIGLASIVVMAVCVFLVWYGVYFIPSDFQMPFIVVLFSIALIASLLANRTLRRSIRSGQFGNVFIMLVAVLILGAIMVAAALLHPVIMRPQGHMLDAKFTDVSECPNKTGSEMDNCYWFFARKNADSTLCDKIQDQRSRDLCLGEMKQKP